MSFGSSKLSITELEARMRPGALSQGGFLGENERLSDVLFKDSQTIAELGIDYGELSEKLRALIQKGKSAPQQITRIGHFEVSVTSYSGFQMCPWSPDIHRVQCTAGGGVQFSSLDWCIRNVISDQKMCGPGLIVHLIRDHHFFEGFESPYRVDPHELAHLLEVGPFYK
jgi:hypothetical protein